MGNGLRWGCGPAARARAIAKSPAQADSPGLAGTGVQPESAARPGASLAGTVMVLVALCLALPVAAGEIWTRCPGIGWQITGGDADAREMECEGVAGATAVLGACGVRIAAAPRIRLAETLPISCGVKVWGLYDGNMDEITLGTPAACAAEASEGSLFQLVETRFAYVATAGHEATHAILHAGGLGADRHVEHEYIAAVVQMQLLPEAARAAVLAPLKIGSDVGLWGLNPLLHALQPGLFIGTAWRHFEGLEDGCAFLRGLAEGTQRLPNLSAF